MIIVERKTWLGGGHPALLGDEMSPRGEALPNFSRKVTECNYELTGSGPAFLNPWEMGQNPF